MKPFRNGIVKQLASKASKDKADSNATVPHADQRDYTKAGTPNSGFGMRGLSRAQEEAHKSVQDNLGFNGGLSEAINPVPMAYNLVGGGNRMEKMFNTHRQRGPTRGDRKEKPPKDQEDPPAANPNIFPVRYITHAALKFSKRVSDPSHRPNDVLLEDRYTQSDNINDARVKQTRLNDAIVGNNVFDQVNKYFYLIAMTGTTAAIILYFQYMK